jgi:hypothetical protein
MKDVRVDLYYTCAQWVCIGCTGFLSNFRYIEKRQAEGAAANKGENRRKASLGTKPSKLCTVNWEFKVEKECSEIHSFLRN